MNDTSPHLVGLNSEQYRAVTSLHGPLLILAGAGSGKTRVLTRRIAHLLRNHVQPHQILAVTFTNKAAQEMKERVGELSGLSGNKVWVSTFHSSCVRILRQDITPLGWSNRFAIYDQDDQLRLIKSLIKHWGYDPKRIQPKSIQSQIEHYKCEMTPLETVVQTQQHRLNDPLIKIWRDYEASLKARDALDFSDLIAKTVHLFQTHPDILSRWQKRFSHILVDEYQDTNRAQHLFLRLLAKPHRNLAVVGDDDQSIYSFRGADVSIIRDFTTEYPEATVIQLEQNYRSTKNILTVANALVAQNQSRVKKKLWTEGQEGSKVVFIAGITPHEEARQVTRTIRRLAAAGQSYEDMVIIYRTHAVSRVFEAAFRDDFIPYRILGGRRFYDRQEIRDILAYLRLVINPNDDAAFLRIVNTPARGIGAKSLGALKDEAREKGQPLMKAAASFSGGSKRACAGIQSFLALIEDWTESARTLHTHTLVERIIEESGYRTMLESDLPAAHHLRHPIQARIDNIDELVRDAMTFSAETSSDSPIDHLIQWMDRMSLTRQGDNEPETNLLTMTTAHNAKGLEYSTVFVVQTMEGMFPHSRCGPEDIEEERRLLYVAFTRAKQRLFVSRSRTFVHPGNPRPVPAKCSRFLTDIPTNACEGAIPKFRSSSHTTVEPLNPKDKTPKSIDISDYTLIDLETPSQLSAGTQVYHHRFGQGKVIKVLKHRVYVNFHEHSPKWVSLMGGTIQLIIPS